MCDVDTSAELPSDVESSLGPDYLSGLDSFDLIVRSPSIHPTQIIQNNDPEILIKVTTITNEFFRVCPTKNIIGVTGTKGKGTTCALITEILRAAGKTVHLGGNIGTPPLDLLNENIQPEDWVVLELANFQLIDMKYSPKIAICLLIEPEHLDWHPSLEEYFNSKKQLFAHQKPEDISIFFARNEYSHDIASAGSGKLISYYNPPGAIIENDDVMIDGQSICSTDEIKLPGRHNWQNICAAVTAVWQISQDVNAARKVVISFSGMEHRLELVRELGGVKYYDDSFGTTPGTAQVAIEAFPEPKIIILGGRKKGVPLTSLGGVMMNNDVKNVIAIGEAGGEIIEMLESFGYKNAVKGENNIEGIVAQARKLAKPGDIVLLSPACTSFDMFKNYAERGEKFKEAVQALV